MAMEMMEHAGSNGDQEGRDTLFLLGGAALIVFGAGMILSTPMVRRYLGAGNIGGLVQAALPDFERYLKIRSM